MNSFSDSKLPWYHYDRERGHTVNITRRLGVNWWRRADANDQPWLVFVLWTPRRSIGQRYVGLIRYRYFSLPLHWPWARLPDYEGIATRSGWCKHEDTSLMIYHGPTWGSWKAAVSWAGTDQEPAGEFDLPALYTSWKECCEEEGLL